MFKGLIGRKIGMTQIFDVNGAAVPVTLLEAGPCFVSQVKTAETDGYNAVQLAFGEVKPKRLTKAHLGHLKVNDLPPVRVLREFRTKKLDGINAGDKLDASVFAEGEHVDVIGVSKGKGFAGAMKRHGFRGGPRTHGQSDRQRSPGSSGATTTPGRVFKGKRGPGHMGNVQVTSSNVRVALVDAERNLIAVHGSVPGPKGGTVIIKEARKQ
ncbi:MAG TPA: 50S ribosomal protein L3 [Anaerolineaceae bacterium]|jgi:large subunit ribosomal protein L3|nr:50S ribosomal protein L3 [Anaerolineales bacterium]HOT52928.1 50S ribosomal protein L3 [Anaerolineaceae bacterium]HPY32476.1 50S ribosomal protein L3 [Anaerolineaceae bacterium]HQC20596.1 50S ribosomal protein L3 [Anaerolineaceae bacterium]HQK42006.1 50S ribosomal protein L3 [Anaerolineaceae bacterium]